MVAAMVFGDAGKVDTEDRLEEIIARVPLAALDE